MRKITVSILFLLAGTLIFSSRRDAQPTPELNRNQTANDLRKELMLRFLKGLDLKQGMKVAEIGCGSRAAFVPLVLGLIGEKGTFWAEDIDRDAVQAFQRDVLTSNSLTAELKNRVRYVVGTPTDPELPEPVDALYMLESYHEFQFPAEMLRALHLRLHTGGRIAILENSNPANRGLSRTAQADAHEIDPDLVTADLTAQGFRVVDTFAPRLPNSHDAVRWLIVAMK